MTPSVPAARPPGQPAALSDAAFSGAPLNTAPPRTRWVVREHDPSNAGRLARELGLHPIVARILSARGFADPVQTRKHLNPTLADNLHDPHELRGLPEAVARIGAALAAGESITIFGDYDVDGITGTSILVLTLRELGIDEAKLDYYIPHRLHQGYGLSSEALEELAGRGVQLVISVDCGMTAIEPAARASELGLDLIITDHHTPAPELPRCVALINPKQPGCTYPFKELSGAGVAFKLAHALLRARHRDAARAKVFLRTLLDLAALGTVADVVPLRGENRAVVTHGLVLLRETTRPGLRALYASASLDGAALECGHIGFVIGPRLNAAGRTEHAKYGVELLLSEDLRESQRLAQQLEGFNLNRRSIEAEIVREALAQVESDIAGQAGAPGPPHVVIAAGEGWHHGVLGIVASRLLARHYRPTLVISIAEDGIAKGSGRSIAGFDLHAALHHCRAHLTQFGGHTMAAGLTMPAAGLDAFREAMNAYAAEMLAPDDLRPTLTVDALLGPEEHHCLTAEFVHQLAALAPFGQENPKPVIALEGFNLADEPRVLKERHLKLRLSTRSGQGLTALAWGMADRLPELANCRGPIRVAGSPTLNTWNGRTSVEFEIKDFQLG